MLEPTIPSQSSPRLPGLVVEVSEFDFDWATGHDPGHLTEQRFTLLGESLWRGAWFLNPITIVHAPTASAEFYKAARKARSRWLDQVRGSLYNHGLRSRARQAERDGRRAALLVLNNPDSPDVDPRFIDPHTRLSDLSPTQRREVLLSGHFAKQLAFTGLMIIDGNHVAPRTWHMSATHPIAPDHPEVTTSHRKIFLAALRDSGDTEHLKQLAREALQAQLDAYPSHAAYVTPDATISSPAATPAFYAAAERCQTRWCVLLNRAVGCGNIRRLRRRADPATFSLVFGGTLVVDGQVYLPGCWPTQTPKPSHLKKTPFNSPTVPLSYLGLELIRPPCRDDELADSRVERAPV